MHPAKKLVIRASLAEFTEYVAERFLVELCIRIYDMT